MELRHNTSIQHVDVLNTVNTPPPVQRRDVHWSGSFHPWVGLGQVGSANLYISAGTAVVACLEARMLRDDLENIIPRYRQSVMGVTAAAQRTVSAASM